MLFRIISHFFRRRKGRTAIAVIAVIMGAAITSALTTVSADVSDKIQREQQAYGANIIVVPNSTSVPVEVGGVNIASTGNQYINESGLYKMKTIFWRYSIVAFAPFLYGLVQSGSDTVILTGTWFNETIRVPSGGIPLPNGTIIQTNTMNFSTGVETLAPWWKVEGGWVSDNNNSQSIVGSSLAEKLKLSVGDTLSISYQGSKYNLSVVGIVTTGSYEDDQVFVNIHAAQEILGKPDEVQKVLVTALIKPDDELANKPHDQMTPDEHVKWYCSPYIGVFIYQIEEAMPSVTAKAIRPVAETEGKILGENQLLFALIALFSIGASAVTVASTLIASILQRRTEIGLMKALGADNLQVATQFLAESGIIGLLGGLLGFPLGYMIAEFVSNSVFTAPISTFNPAILPITILIAVGISLLGSVIPVRKAMRIEPSTVLHGE